MRNTHPTRLSLSVVLLAAAFMGVLLAVPSFLHPGSASAQLYCPATNSVYYPQSGQACTSSQGGGLYCESTGTYYFPQSQSCPAAPVQSQTYCPATGSASYPYSQTCSLTQGATWCAATNSYYNPAAGQICQSAATAGSMTCPNGVVIYPAQGQACLTSAGSTSVYCAATGAYYNPSAGQTCAANTTAVDGTPYTCPSGVVVYPTIGQSCVNTGATTSQTYCAATNSYYNPAIGQTCVSTAVATGGITCANGVTVYPAQGQGCLPGENPTTATATQTYCAATNSYYNPSIGQTCGSTTPGAAWCSLTASYYNPSLGQSCVVDAPAGITVDAVAGDGASVAMAAAGGFRTD